MRRVEVIQQVIQKRQSRSYLEIGVAEAKTFASIVAHIKIAVDPELRIFATRRKFFERFLPGRKTFCYPMTSDEFFARHGKKHRIDVAFIDGLHTHVQSLRVVHNCLRILRPNGVILMHDCSPTSETMAYPALSIREAANAKLPNWNGLWCGDVWKTIVYLRSSCYDLNVFVLDTDFGIGVITRGMPVSMIQVPDVNELSYFDLEQNRTELLNLKHPSFLYQWLDGTK